MPEITKLIDFNDSIDWQARPLADVLQESLAGLDDKTCKEPKDLLAKREQELEEYLRITEQALLLMKDVYVNRPLKESLHAAEPVRRLELLKNELNRRKRSLRRMKKKKGEKHLLLDDQAELFGVHYRLCEIFASVHDRHVGYSFSLPGLRQSGNSVGSGNAFLGFEIEVFYDHDERLNALRRRYVVSHVSKKIEDAPPGAKGLEFKPGVEILEWNGVPIARAVARMAAREKGSNPAAQHARGLQRLTVRSLDYALPPDETSVIVTYAAARDGTRDPSGDPGRSDETGEIRFGWQWIPSEPELGGVGIFSNRNVEGAAGFEAALRHELHDACDFELDSIRGVRKRFFSKPQKRDLRLRVKPIRANNANIQEVLRASILTYDEHDRRYGYLRIYSFRPRMATWRWSVGKSEEDRFVKAVQDLLEIMDRRAPDGLIIDIRDNPGGNIRAGERILQFLTPRRIEPMRFEFLASPLIRDLIGEAEDHPWNAWRSSLQDAPDTGATYSSGFPITRPPEKCNEIGQRYYGPVILVTSALSYSTSDIFAAGFQDHGIGKILGVDSTTGAGGANVIAHTGSLRAPGLLEFSKAAEKKPEGRKLPLAKLPKGVNMRVALRRAVRVADGHGALLEHLGVRSNELHPMTYDDLLHGNRDLLDRAVEMLAQKPRRELKLSPVKRRRKARKRDALKIKIEAKSGAEELSRIDIYVDGRPHDSRTMPAKKPWKVPAAGQLRVEVFGLKDGTEVLVANRTEDLGELAGARAGTTVD